MPYSLEPTALNVKLSFSVNFIFVKILIKGITTYTHTHTRVRARTKSHNNACKEGVLRCHASLFILARSIHLVRSLLARLLGGPMLANFIETRSKSKACNALSLSVTVQ